MTTGTKKLVGWAAFIGWLVLSAPVFDEKLDWWGLDIPVWVFSPVVFVLGAVYLWGTDPKGKDEAP